MILLSHTIGSLDNIVIFDSTDDWMLIQATVDRQIKRDFCFKLEGRINRYLCNIMWSGIRSQLVREL